jgi:hypothetical protein
VFSSSHASQDRLLVREFGRSDGVESGTGTPVHVPPTRMANAKSKKAPAPAEAPATQEAKRKPLKMLRVEDCSASIWAREYVVQGQPKRFFTVTLERSYKDRDGAWKYTKSFDPESLGKVIALCQQASEVIQAL